MMGGDRSQGGRRPHAHHIDVLRSLDEVPGTAANGTIVSAGPAVWAVERVVPASDRTLRLEFRDGRRGVFDFRPYLDFGPYAPLRDVKLFMKAHVAYDTVVWSDDIDIAPERLYSDCTPSVAAAK